MQINIDLINLKLFEINQFYESIEQIGIYNGFKL